MLEFSFVGLFARALEGIDVKQLITNVGAGVGSAPAAGAAPAAAAADSAAKEEKKEEKKEESDMSDDDMGFGKFEMFSGLSYATCIRILGKVLCKESNSQVALAMFINIRDDGKRVNNLMQTWHSIFLFLPFSPGIFLNIYHLNVAKTDANCSKL